MDAGFRRVYLSVHGLSIPVLIFLTVQNFGYAQEVPPQFYEEGKCGIPVPENNGKILSCSAYSQPAAMYRWLHNGRYITKSSNSGTITLNSISRSDAGEYRCQATNKLGSILSIGCQVEVAYLDPFSTMSPVDNVNVVKGDAATIVLPPLMSHPAPTVEWYKSSVILAKEGPRHQVTLDMNLVILETQLSENNNRYMATAINGQTTTTEDTNVFTLKVTDNGDSSPIVPSFVVAPSDTTVNQGEASVSLECIANARPISDLHTKWYRVQNGQRTEITLNDKYLMNPIFRRQLVIKNPVKSDNGVYECEAKLESQGVTYPTATAQANLTVYETPAIISSFPLEITKDYSQNISLECKALGTPAPTIHWYHNARAITSSSSTKYTISDEGTLSITRLDINDAGMYQCFARNAAGEKKKNTLIRVNSAPPNIVDAPGNLSIIAGLDARFPCKVEGAPQPVVVWSKGSTVVEISGRFQILEDNELLIAQAIPEDSGHYICSATNSMGSQTADAYLSVLMQTQITSPPQNVTTIKGSTATMQCGVSSDPNVQVTWRWFHFDSSNAPGQDISTSQRHTVSADGTLSIVGVYNIDIGNYECHVLSIGGNDTRRAFLQVTELPHKPVIISTVLDTIDLKTVNITWSPGFDGNSPINRFIVQYRKVVYVADKGIVESEDWIVKEGQVAPSRRWYVISGLRPARYFQFKVSAVNSVGEGPASDPKPNPPILMPEQAPSSPPKGFYGSPRSNTSIMLQWQLPPEDSWNGDLQGYMIRYKLVGYSDLTFQSINTTNYLVTTYELTNLIFFQEYEIQIAAYNREGVGIFSDSIKEWTMEGVPTRPPKDVNATAINSTTVEIVWKPVDANYLNGIVLGYKIRATQSGSTVPERVIEVPPSASDPYGEQMVHMYDLKKFTNYTFSVLCYTGKGDGPKSSPVSVQTKEDVPDAVATLAFPEVLDTSIKVVWSPPVNVNGILLGYTVQWKNHTIPKKKQVDLNPSFLTYTVRDLSPTTNYTIFVFARTAVGAGPSKSAVVESGVPPESPKPPHNLGIADIQARSVLLQFLPGYDGKTSINTWIVEGQIGTNTTWAEIFRISDPPATSINVRNLLPYTWYRLRIIAVNIVARSNASEPTREFQTRQDFPNVPPSQLTVRFINSTALRVSWAPLSIQDWNGAPKGYRILYKQENLTQWSLVEVDLVSDSHILTNLEEWMVYEVKMQAYNDVGVSSSSPIQRERTRDAAPSHGPADLSCETNSSTSINCTWGEVPYLDQNGVILGYKVQYTDKSSPGNPPAILNVPGNETHGVVITGLRKYVKYEIQVLAYTRIGDGILSIPPAVVETLEDVPGPPMYLWFPEVTYSTALIRWSPPVEPNGIITGYVVSYWIKDTSNVTNSSVLAPSQQELRVISLKRETYYIFSVKAKTRIEKGWGTAAQAKVYTQINRRQPDSPTKPQLTSEVQARAVTISWQAGFDGYGPLRNYTVQYQGQDGVWKDIDDIVPADVTSFTIIGLYPNTRYSFRVAANNDIGRSPYSEKSDEVTTLQDKPEGAPKNLIVVPKTTDSVNVTWKQPDTSTWNGDLLGYYVQYRKQGNPSYQDKTILYPQHTTVLSNLDKYVEYEVQVLAFNSIGNGPHSIPTSVFVGVAAPSAPPLNVTALPKNATTLTVTWLPPPVDTQNGKLSGYRVSYRHVGATQTNTAVVRENSIDINKLEKYSNYSISIQAYNTYGDGPASPVTYGRTEQWSPGPPTDLDFNNITMTSLNVSWKPPAKPNGIIIFYDLTYRSHADQRLVKLSNLSGSQHHYWINKLEENVTYSVTVVGRTIIGPGPEIQNDVKTGPQGYLSPEAPHKPSVQVRSRNALSLSWENGNEGVSPILGYYIRARTVGEWQIILHQHSPAPKVLVSWPSQCSAGGCQFSVVAFNSKSISYPSPPSDLITQLEVASAKPVYNEWWFLVIVALAGLVVILVIISLLCLVARNQNKDLKKSTANSMSTTTLDEGGFTTTEIRQSRRSLARIGNGTLRSVRSRDPPRPSPASVTYSEDLEGAKGPIPSDEEEDDNSSTVSRKPSNLGDDSTEPSDDESDLTEKPFPPPPQLPPPASPPPPPFTSNPYVNDSARRSWRNQNQNTDNYRYNPTYNDNYNSNYNAYTYTDSENDSSHYAMSLNSGRLVMNNAAGSRAPLPGFSSFV